jgi:hemolysin III
LAGGLAYSVGAGIYALKGVRYSHFVWHLFVIAGSACHFIAVLGYAV